MQHKIGMRHYAKIPLKSVGREAWEKQDITGVWSDAGEVQAVVQRHLGNMIGASDYLAEGEASLALSPENDILLGIRIYNDGAQMIAHASLRQLLFQALSELRPHVAIDPQAQALLSQLKALGHQLANLGNAPKQKTEDTAA